jgi:energy-coupling factor transporter ATP-binding protein EcfA2
MFEEYQICPYTGLRSFTEEESLYFKGREEHIESATGQLQRNKFLMLTGASGDGKSSLVYAGIIPNARAGFLKSKYTQWCLADFRPERTPFTNLCKSLARQLEIDNPNTVASELQHGFSALIDLYKNSKRFVDVNSITWQQADENGRAALKREAANLIVLVDQFEEFFTNPENYHRGVPSRDSNLVLNLLLETARIALEEDLPVYIIFTMRSDYIGQCAAFRGLPEYIGFSQFFVPRLNRSQLQQVIEEPAVLSGNQIARRLTERLIHDITEGVDQLPILQHALNQIWHAASNGKEEMDLIHYAMVGGMAVHELPDEQVQRFHDWFQSQPAQIKACYQEPNLQNVLDTHTNKLYEQAAVYYKEKTGLAISDADAKAIIKNAFVCLTKIDQSRAVRNRMTLKEITDIFGRKGFGAKEVGAVLNIFREPGNTFIRPFILDDPESHRLKDDDVLDITHESLIRNWEYLEEWAKEEFDNYTVSLDFEQQLNRWVESKKSNGFLLSIGQLTYFENWYSKVKPNVYWIARYLPEDIDQKDKLTKAKEILSNAQDFLRRSAHKHAITLTIMKYGPRRIAAVLAIIALLTLSSFAVRDYFKRQDSYIIKQINAQVFQIANSPKANFYNKSILFAEMIKGGHVTVDDLINGITDTLQKVNVASRLGAFLVFQGHHEPAREMYRSLEISTSLLTAYKFEGKDVLTLERLTKESNYLRATIGLALIYNPTEDYKKLRTATAGFSASLVKYILKVQPEKFIEINHLNGAIENAINNRAFSTEDMKQLIAQLSPFENANRAVWITKNYHRDNLMIRGFFDYGYKFNGLYQELAYIYAALGDVDKALQCVDTLLKYNQTYYQTDYTAMPDNANNIAITFYSYGQSDQLEKFVEGYANRKKISQVEFYQRLIGRNVAALYPSANINEGFGLLTNLNAQYCDVNQMTFLFDRFRKAIEKTASSVDERNFLFALSFKNEAILTNKILVHTNSGLGQAKLDELFNLSLSFYRNVDNKYLETSVNMGTTNDADAKAQPRKYLYIYPDYRYQYTPLEPRQYHYWYSSDYFLEYLLDNQLIDKLYAPTDFSLLSNWIDFHHFFTLSYWKGCASFRTEARREVFKKLDEYLTSKNATHQANFNHLYLSLGNRAFLANELDQAKNYYSKLDKNTLIGLMRNAEGGLNREAFSTIAYAISNLIRIGNMDEAYQLIRLFKNPINRSSLYGFAAVEMLLSDGTDPTAPALIDSAKTELSRLKDLSINQPNRQLISFALILQNPQANEAEAYRVIKNIFDKTSPIQRICRANALRGDLHSAQQHIITNINDNDLALFLWNMVYGNSLKQKHLPPQWQVYDSNHNFPLTRFIPFVNDDN